MPRVAEATQFGVNRMRDRIYGVGYPWPFTFTAVFVQNGEDWRFHTIHWSFPSQLKESLRCKKSNYLSAMTLCAA